MQAAPAAGARLGIAGFEGGMTPPISGTQDWQPVEALFFSGNTTSAVWQCALGTDGDTEAFTPARGAAWFDDLAIERAEPSELALELVLGASEHGRELPSGFFSLTLPEGTGGVYGGLWAELLQGRKFFFAPGSPDSPWYTEAPDDAVRSVFSPDWMTSRTLHVSLEQDETVRFVQGGIPLREGERYEGSVITKGDESLALRVSLRWGAGQENMGEADLEASGAGFTKLPFSFAPTGSTEEGQFEVEVSGEGTLEIGGISLMPASHQDGFRKQALEHLADLQPSVLFWPAEGMSKQHWENTDENLDNRPPSHTGHVPGGEASDFSMREFMALCNATGAQAGLVLDPQRITPSAAAAAARKADALAREAGLEAIRWELASGAPAAAIWLASSEMLEFERQQLEAAISETASTTPILTGAFHGQRAQHEAMPAKAAPKRGAPSAFTLFGGPDTASDALGAAVALHAEMMEAAGLEGRPNIPQPETHALMKLRYGAAELTPAGACWQLHRKWFADRIIPLAGRMSPLQAIAAADETQRIMTLSVVNPLPFAMTATLDVNREEGVAGAAATAYVLAHDANAWEASALASVPPSFSFPAQSVTLLRFEAVAEETAETTGT